MSFVVLFLQDAMSGYSQWLRSHSTGITTTVMSHYVSHCLGVSTYRVKSREQVRIDLENNFIIATNLQKYVKIKNTAAAK